MKKSIIILLIFTCMSLQLSSCASAKSHFKFETKADMGMFGGCLSGVIVGGIFNGNILGAMFGGILGTAFGTFIGQYFDKEMASREEALMKYTLRDSVEKLLIENSLVVSQNIAIGSKINTDVQYTILAPFNIKKIKITETRMLFNEREGLIKIARRQVFRTQGTHSSMFTFNISEKISKGNSIIITIISNDEQTKTIISPMIIG